MTGTNGKTSVAWMLASCSSELYGKGASLGTLGVTKIEQQKIEIEERSLTTFETIEYQRSLREIRDAGIKHVAVEVSSQGIAHDRTPGHRMGRSRIH